MIWATQKISEIQEKTQLGKIRRYKLVAISILYFFLLSKYKYVCMYSSLVSLILRRVKDTECVGSLVEHFSGSPIPECSVETV